MYDKARVNRGTNSDSPGQRRAGFPSQYKYNKITLFYSNCKYICVGEDIVFSIDINLNIEAYLSRFYMLIPISIPKFDMDTNF